MLFTFYPDLLCPLVKSWVVLFVSYSCAYMFLGTFMFFIVTVIEILKNSCFSN